jgi:hypothetical protein
MYEGLMRTLQPLVLPMNNQNVDLKTPGVTCNHCRKNVTEIFQESGEFCLHCWQERTYPNA